MDATPATQAESVEDWTWRTTAYAWWIVVVLGLGLMLSLMDRMVISLMIGPIKHDLALSDTQISLISGLAFTLLYVVAGLPLGRIADRGNRRGLAAGSIIFWSLMTALCGGATSFGQLFAARLGVGVGEAGLSPAALSLLSDYFPREKRARPLAFLSIGTTAGAGIALIVGGAIVHAVGSSGGARLPLLGPVRTWQAIFVLLGVSGILFAALFSTVREPRRLERSVAPPSDVLEVGRFLLARRALFVPQILGPSLAVLVLISFHIWMPTMLIRRFGWGVPQAGLVYGSLIAAAGVLGIVLAGWTSEHLAQRGARDAANRVAFFAAASAFPLMAIAPLLPSAPLVLALLFPGIALLTVPSALAPAALQGASPNELRGQVFAIYLFVLSLLGYAAGPLLVALITDRLIGDEHALHLSLALVAAIALPLSAANLAVAGFVSRRLRV